MNTSRSRGVQSARVMDRQHPGVIHFQDGWRERALDRRVPITLWLRVTFFCYGSQKKNGHAVFAEGELARVFGKSSSEVSRALATAIRWGRKTRQRGRVALNPQSQRDGSLGR